MKVNGRSIERVQRNVGFCDAKLAVNRERLLLALARRKPEQVRKISSEMRRVGELRERWLAEGFERALPGLNNVILA